MKIRGRFIAILAVLGLLMALLPLAPAGAAVGDLTIIGGADQEGAFFSDKAGFNVLEIAVEDADLSPVRVGTARYLDIASVSRTAIDLNEGVVAGELEITQKLDGGLMNPVCVDLEPQGNLDGVADSPYRVDADNDGVLDLAPTTTDETLNVDACAPQGVVILGPGPNDAYIDNPATTDADQDESADNTYTIALKEILRDSDGPDGVVDANDVTVRLDNDELESPADFLMGTPLDDMGLGVQTISLIDKPRDPNNSSIEDENLVVEYEYSEYKFTTTTPIRIAGTQILSGDSFATATNEKQIDGVNSGTAVVSATGTGVDTDDDFVIATFVYNVEDKESKFVTVSSSTSQARNLNRVLDGYESTARSNLFESSVLLVTHDDFATIDSVAKDATYAGDSKTVKVSDLTASNLDNNQDLADRIAGAVWQSCPLNSG